MLNIFCKLRKTRVVRWCCNTSPLLLICLGIAILLCGNVAFCENGAAQAFTAIYSVLKTITTVVGTIFLIVGIVRFIIAHANEDGPNQQKAAMLIATGIALIVIGPAMDQVVPWNTFVEGVDGTSYSGGGSSGGGGSGGGTGQSSTGYPSYDEGNGDTYEETENPEDVYEY